MSNNITGASSIITNIFPAKAKATPITFDMTAQDQLTSEVAQSLGNLPFVFYGDSYQIDVQDISYFSLFYSGPMPCFKMSFFDSLNLLKDKAFPLDDQTIKVFLNPRSNQLKDILIQFKITKFSANEGRYNFEGVLDVDLLHVIQYQSYSSMSSMDALQAICKSAGLGFNTNLDNTNDTMTWINTGDIVSDFMEEIVESSYKSDTSFITSFIDYYYNFNLVDLSQEINRDISNDQGITDRTLSEVQNTTDKEILTNLILSNDESFRETNLFFEKYRIINNSTEISLDSGYNISIDYYDEIAKEFLIFNMSSITSTGDKTIILKGQPQDETFFKLNTKVYYLGKMDTDNVHKNYTYAQMQNEKNIFDLEKIGLEIIMKDPNFNIYKYQKIKIFISNQTNTPSADLRNQRLSGDWLIIDIKYVLSNNEFTQTIKLVKRELELSDDELSQEPPVI